MNEGSILQALSRETKALIIVSEFEARRMPMFQLRMVLGELVSSPEEKKIIIDLVENDLRATGYQADQVAAFLQDLAGEAPAEKELRATRRMRSPFAVGFEGQGPGGQPAAAAGAPGQPGPAGPPASPPPPAPRAAPTAAASRLGVAAPGAAPAATPPGRAGPTPFKTVTRVGGYAPPPQEMARSAPAPGAPGVPGVVPATTGQPAGPVGFGGTRISATRVVGARDTLYFGAPVEGVHIEGAQKPRVLLADDDKRIRIVFRLALERLGCVVIEAADGNEAWRIIQEGSIDLAVLDMKMPGLHGLEVLSRMVDRRVTPPVVVCSAYDNLKDEFLVASYPKLRYLVKPVAAETLESAVRELLELHAK